MPVSHQAERKAHDELFTRRMSVVRLQPGHDHNGRHCRQYQFANLLWAAPRAHRKCIEKSENDAPESCPHPKARKRNQSSESSLAPTVKANEKEPTACSCTKRTR